MLFTRALFQAVTKPSTGLAGIAVHQNPRPHLIQTYNTTLESLTRIPSTAVYRQATESLTQHRLNIVESTENIEEIESKLTLVKLRKSSCKLRKSLNYSQRWKNGSLGNLSKLLLPRINGFTPPRINSTFSLFIQTTQKCFYIYNY
ncbi:unnamed protein product [Mucor hiemalis]